MEDLYERLGLSKQTIIHLFVLNQLKDAPNYPFAIFKDMKEKIPILNKSVPYFYGTMERMESNGWIYHYEDKKKKIYSLTDEGKKKMNDYIEEHYHKLMAVYKLSKHFLYLLTGASGPISINEDEITHEHRKYFNKLIDVRKLFRYLFLQYLVNRHFLERTVKAFSGYIETKYHWTANEGYLYHLATELTKEGLVHRYWLDDSRTNRIYELTELGKTLIAKEGEAAIYPIRQLYEMVKLFLQLFDIKQPVTKSTTHRL